VPVARIVLIVLSSETRCRPSPRNAIRAALIAEVEATAFARCTGRLDQSADRVAGEPEVVLNADLRRVLHLLGCPAEHLGE
jgi:hypothetical protein